MIELQKKKKEASENHKLVLIPSTTREETPPKPIKANVWYSDKSNDQGMEEIIILSHHLSRI